MSFGRCGSHLRSSVPAVDMEELQVIKKELTLIKTQIDGLLDSLDRMDTHTGEHKGEAFIPKSLRWQIGAGEVK